jgi:hypothetical protein
MGARWARPGPDELGHVGRWMVICPRPHTWPSASREGVMVRRRDDR